MKYLVTFFLFLSLNCLASNEIVSVVDDDIISSNTLENRYRIMLKERNYKPENISQQDAKQIKLQILHSLINEKILRQEAEKLNVKVSEEDLEFAIKQLEQKQNIKSGTFRTEIKAQGLPLKIVLDQIQNTILWEKLMAELFVPKIEISITEIYEFMDKFHPEKTLVDFYIFKSNKHNRKDLSELHHFIKDCEQVKNQTIQHQNVIVTNISTTLKDVQDPQIREVIVAPNTKKSVIFESGPESIEFALLCSKEYKVTQDNISHLRNLLKEKKAHLQLEQYIKNVRQKKFIEIYNID